MKLLSTPRTSTGPSGRLLRSLAGIAFLSALSMAQAQTTSSDSIQVTLTVNTFVSISFYSHTAVAWTNTDGGTTSSYTTSPLRFKYTTNANSTVRSSLTPVGNNGGLTYSSAVSSNGFLFGSSFAVSAGTSADGFATATISGLSLKTTPSTYTSTLTIVISAP